MKLEVTVSLKDYVRAAYFFSYTRWTLNIFRIAALLIIIAYFYIIVTPPHLPLTRDLILIPLTAAYIFIVMPFMVYVRTKRLYLAHESIQLPITYDFKETGIEISRGDEYSKLSWVEIYKVRETSNLFYFFQDKKVANLVPKRYFTDEQIIELRDLIRRSGVKSKLKSRIR